MCVGPHRVVTARMYWTLQGTVLIGFLLGCLLAFLLGCGGAPQRTIPKGYPFPTKLGAQTHAQPLDKVRCIGGAIGGCTLWERYR